MKIDSLLAIIFLLFIQSCGNETESSNTTSEMQESEHMLDTAAIVQVEEPPIEINETVQAILNKSDTTYLLPMAIDTNFIKAIDFNEKTARTALSFENGQYLGTQILDNAPTFNGEYYIKIFCELDSLKSVGAYEAYVNNIDIGMMQIADAFVEGLVDLGDQKHMLLWSISFSTYEACPYASGAVVFGTVLNHYEVQNTMLLAEVSGGGDPPAWGDTNVSSTISTALEIETYWVNRSGEDDFPTDITQETYGTQVSETGLINTADKDEFR